MALPNPEMPLFSWRSRSNKSSGRWQTRLARCGRRAQPDAELVTAMGHAEIPELSNRTQMVQL